MLAGTEKEALSKGIELGYIVKKKGDFRLVFPFFTQEQLKELEVLFLEFYGRKNKRVPMLLSQCLVTEEYAAKDAT